jgi:hypothetical protein
MQFGTAFVPDGRDLCWIGTKDRRYWSNGLGCIPAISKLRAAGEFFARQILSVLDILGVAFANLDLRTLRVRPTLVGRLGGLRNRVRMPVIEWSNRGQPQTRARRKSRFNSVVGSTTSNPSPCWPPLDTGVRRLHLFALVTESQGTTEHTEHTEARHTVGRIYFRVFGVFCG